jgi:hypothetical protein
MKVPKKVLAGHRMIWGGKIPAGALAQLKKEYARMTGKRKKANPRRNIRQLKKKLTGMGRTRAQRRETVGHVKRLSRARSNPAMSAAPLLKVAREAGARRVQVMRNKAGKPTGVKFLK